MDKTGKKKRYAKKSVYPGIRVLGSNRAKCGAPHSAPNPERNKIRSTVGERALGGDFLTIYSAF